MDLGGSDRQKIYTLTKNYSRTIPMAGGGLVGRRGIIYIWLYCVELRNTELYDDILGNPSLCKLYREL